MAKKKKTGEELKFGEKKEYEPVSYEEAGDDKDDIRFGRIAGIFIIIAAAATVPAVLEHLGLIGLLAKNLMWGGLILAVIVIYLILKNRQQ